MTLSKYQLDKLLALKERAFTLYKEGYPYREVGRILDKSHEWVRQAVKEQEKLSTVDKNLKQL